MSPLYLHNNKLLVVGGKLAVNEACCCEEPGCPCPDTVQWGGNAQELTFTIGGTTCTVCMSQDSLGSLNREDGGCYYFAEYDLSACVGSFCLVKVIFDLGNFPDCECEGNGDYCDYFIISWTTILGSCTVDDITAGAFC
jgi:hypothetical protein